MKKRDFFRHPRSVVGNGVSCQRQVEETLDTLFNFEGLQSIAERRKPFCCVCTFTKGGKWINSTIERPNRDGGVAQLGEHLPCKQGVDSSILFISTSSCTAGKSRSKREGTKSFRLAKREAAGGCKNGRPEWRTRDGHRHGLIAQVVRAHA